MKFYQIKSSWFYGPTFEFLKRAGLFEIEKLFEVSKSQSVLENSDLKFYPKI